EAEAVRIESSGVAARLWRRERHALACYSGGTWSCDISLSYRTERRRDAIGRYEIVGRHEDEAACEIDLVATDVDRSQGKRKRNAADVDPERFCQRCRRVGRRNANVLDRYVDLGRRRRVDADQRPERHLTALVLERIRLVAQLTIA